MVKNQKEESKLSVKDLKSKLDDNVLDLSMHELTTVPVKAIAQLPKASTLDLSANLLQVLPLDFATLTQLVKLDLSQNRIDHLPDNFGELRNLVHLDLYKNQLQELPLSFSKLKQLKWLDLKDNPLEPTLGRAAGDCLDEKECKTAAFRVVQHVQKLQSDFDRERHKRLQHEREIAISKEAEEKAERMEKAATRKREKEKRKQQTADTAPKRLKNPSDRAPPANGANASRNVYRGDRGGGKPEGKSRTKKSWFRWLVGWLCTLLLLCIVGFALTALGIYHNCTATERWLPDSAGLCADLYLMAKTGQTPKSAQKNILRAVDGVKLVVQDRTAHFAHYIRSTDYSTVANDGWSTVRNGTVSAAAWIQKTSAFYWHKASEWYDRNASEIVGSGWKQTKMYAAWSLEQAKILARIAVEIAIDVIDFAMEAFVAKSVQLYHWTSDSLNDLYRNGDMYWKKAQVWWSQ